MPTKQKSAAPWPKTVRAAAAALGVGRDALYEWLARGAPAKTRRGFDIPGIQAWHDANVAPTSRVPRGFGGDFLRGTEGETEEALSDRSRLLRAQADERAAKALLAELQVKIQRGEFLPMAEVKDRDIARVAVVKRGLLTLPRTAAPRLVGLKEKEMVAVLTKLVRELLERFAKM